MSAERHTYLGETDDVIGRTWLEEGRTLCIPLFPLSGVVLFPNGTVPLRLFRLAEVTALKQIAAREECERFQSKHIGIANISYRHSAQGHRREIASVGTTAEVVSVGTSTDPASADAPSQPSLAVVAKGRQRFELVRAFNDANGLLWGEVTILPELPPLEAPAGIHPALCGPRGGGGGWAAAAGANRVRPGRAHQACAVRWPKWAYDMYDARALVRRIQEQLRGLQVLRCAFCVGILYTGVLNFTGTAVSCHRT